MITLRYGAWLSLVERSVRDREVVGSNPIAPTIKREQKCSRLPFQWKRQSVRTNERDGTTAMVPSLL